MPTETKQILKEIKEIKSDIRSIKMRVFDDEDTTMTAADKRDYRKYLKEKQAGKLISHEQLRKELCI